MRFAPVNSHLTASNKLGNPAHYLRLLGYTNSIQSHMSHFTTIRTQIRDVDALRAACSELGLDLLQNAEARGYYTQTTKGEYVIRLHGPYDIALNRQDRNDFTLTTDWYNNHVEAEVGVNYGKLIQLYGVHKATIEARKKGWTVQRKQVGNNIKLTIGL